jgi:hypothetical protein
MLYASIYISPGVDRRALASPNSIPTTTHSTTNMRRQLLPILAFLVARGTSDEVAITKLSLFQQAQEFVQYCLTQQSLAYSATYECPTVTPADCLCATASVSHRIVTGIESCVTDGIGKYSDLTTATQIWADYCSTNAGVSAKDEVPLLDIPLYHQGENFIAYCAENAWSKYSMNYNCDFVTPAPCLCTSTALSFEIVNSIMTCVTDGGKDVTDVSTASALWNSYCAVNLENPATRTVGLAAAAGMFDCFRIHTTVLTG